VHHRLHAGTDRRKPLQPQQVECCRLQAGQRTSAIATAAVGVLVELAVTDPAPALNTPAVAHQFQQGLWGGAQAGEKQVGGLKRSAVSGAGSGHLHNPAGANQALADVCRCLLCPQRPGDVPAMAELLIRCHKRDRALSLELGTNVADQCLLVGFHRHQEVGPLLPELPNNGF